MAESTFADERWGDINLKLCSISNLSNIAWHYVRVSPQQREWSYSTIQRLAGASERWWWSLLQFIWARHHCPVPLLWDSAGGTEPEKRYCLSSRAQTCWGHPVRPLLFLSPADEEDEDAEDGVVFGISTCRYIIYIIICYYAHQPKCTRNNFLKSTIGFYKIDCPHHHGNRLTFLSCFFIITKTQSQ